MLEMRTSERRTLRQCAKRWEWSQVEGLVPLTEATPLWFGSAVHESLAEYYKVGTERGPAPAETFEKHLGSNRSLRVESSDGESEYVDALELGTDMLKGYVEHFGDEPRREVVATEIAGSVVLPRPEITLFGVKSPKVDKWLRYHFTIDAVFRDLDTGELWLQEHKTAASIWDSFLPLDDQAGSYWAVAPYVLRKQGLLGAKEEIAGIEYNFLRKAMRDTRPRNEDGLATNLPKKDHYITALLEELDEDEESSLRKLTLVQLQEASSKLGIAVLGDVSAKQPASNYERHQVYRSRGERSTMIKRIQQEAIFAEAYRNGWLPIVKSPSNDVCRSCPFRRLCEMDEQGDQYAVEEFKTAMFKTRDPYEAYR